MKKFKLAELIATLDKEGKEDLVKKLKEENNIRYGLVTRDGEIVDMLDPVRLRQELHLRSVFGAPAILVLQ